MEKKKVAFVKYVLIISILILLLNLVVLFNKPIERHKIYTSLEVSDRIGFDVNGSALMFGKLPPAGATTRNLVFSNTNNFPVTLRLFTQGNITSLLQYESSIQVRGNETIRIPISASVPANFETGFYEGYVNVNVYPVRYAGN